MQLGLSCSYFVQLLYVDEAKHNWVLNVENRGLAMAQRGLLCQNSA
jgi:hypothetical protein